MTSGILWRYCGQKTVSVQIPESLDDKCNYLLRRCKWILWTAKVTHRACRATCMIIILPGEFSYNSIFTRIICYKFNIWYLHKKYIYLTPVTWFRRDADCGEGPGWLGSSDITRLWWNIGCCDGMCREENSVVTWCDVTSCWNLRGDTTLTSPVPIDTKVPHLRASMTFKNGTEKVSVKSISNPLSLHIFSTSWRSLTTDN